MAGTGNEIRSTIDKDLVTGLCFLQERQDESVKLTPAQIVAAKPPPSDWEAPKPSPTERKELLVKMGWTPQDVHIVLSNG